MVLPKICTPQLHNNMTQKGKLLQFAAELMHINKINVKCDEVQRCTLHTYFCIVCLNLKPVK